MNAVNPILVCALLGFICGLLILRESPKAAQGFIHWLLEYQAGREAYRKARKAYRAEHELDVRGQNLKEVDA